MGQYHSVQNGVTPGRLEGFKVLLSSLETHLVLQRQLNS